MQAVEARPGFKFGADPELFVFDDNDRAVSAAGLIPGTKTSPYPVDCGAVQVDGMAAEFNINPASSFEEFNHNVDTVLAELARMLPRGYSLRAIPSVEFSQDVWDAAPDEAKELGCSPDFNAWTGDVNTPPLTTTTLRTAAGHLHIGWTEGADTGDLQHILNCQDLVKQLDWYLGGWSLQLDPDPTRRLLYGKAGACRFKPYGVEYRVLSNFWVMDTERRMMVWNRMQKAIEDMRTKYQPEKMRKNLSAALIQMIDQSIRNKDLEAACPYPLMRIEEATMASKTKKATAADVMMETLNSQTFAYTMPEWATTTIGGTNNG